MNVVQDEESLIPAWRAAHGYSVPILLGGMATQRTYNLRMTPTDYVLDATQSFQNLGGTISVGGRSVRVTEAKLRGSRLRLVFTADLGSGPVRHEFDGRVSGDLIDGTVVLSGTRMQSQLEWNARR